MAVRWFIGSVAGAAFVVGLVVHVLPLAIGGLLGLLGAVAGRPGTNPLAAPYRDVPDPLPVDRKQDW